MTALAILLFATYISLACVALKKEIATTPRDPETGIVLGTEAIELGDPTADSACLLLHGFVGSRIDFADLGERLAEEGFYVRMARLPGHGTTPRDLARQSPEDLYAGALKGLDDLRSRFDEVHVIGFSMGGTLATLLAAREEVDSLVLIAPYYGVTYKWYYVLPAPAWNTILSPVIPYLPKSEGFIRVNRREAVPSMYSYRSIPTRGVRTLNALGKRARRKETLERVTVPVLVLQSRGDDAASPKATARAFELLGSTDKTLRWYTDRSNHHLLWDNDRVDARRRILRFLNRARQRYREGRIRPAPARGVVPTTRRR